MKINLFSFSHAKCSGSIRKLVCCADGVRKISPLQGDGNDNISEFAFLFQSKEDKSPVRGRKQVCICVHYGLFSKEDKSPARGRWMLTVGSIENRKRCCYGIFVCDGIVGKSVI